MPDNTQAPEEELQGVDDSIDTQPYEAIRERKVLIQTYDYAIRQLMDMVIEGDLILDPDYQRNYRWDDEKASKFIESIILNIPVPVLYFAEEGDSSFSVIDGQQRLTSLFRYIKPQEVNALYPSREFSELVLSQNLKLRPDLRGKRYLDLSREERATLTKRAVRCIVVLNESDSTLKFEVFERLNTGSVSLTPQEARNCIYRGKYNTLIKRLAQNVKFRQLVSLPELALKSMKDVELVLRFFAYRELTEQTRYSDNYTEYLNSHMEENREVSEARQVQLELLFNETVDLIYQTLGVGVAFRKPINPGNPLSGAFARNLINGAIYESQMICFSNLAQGNNIPINLRDKVFSAFSNDDYWRTLSQGTTKKGTVLRRIRTLAEIIEAQ